MADDIRVTADYTDLQLLRRELLGVGKDAQQSAGVFEREYNKVERTLAKTSRASQQYYNDLLGVTRQTNSAQKSASAFRNILDAIEQDTKMADAAARHYNDTLLGINRNFKSARDSAAVFRDQLGEVARSTNNLGAATAASTRRIGQGQVVVQQAGYQIGDFIVQVQSGTNAFVAFGQQATQVAGTLTLFGGPMVAIGAALSVAIPLATAFAAAMMRVRESTEQVQTELDRAKESLASWNQEIQLFQSIYRDLGEMALARNLESEIDKLESLRTRLAELEEGGLSGGRGGEVDRARTLRQLIILQEEAVELAREEFETYKETRDQRDQITNSLERSVDLTAEYNDWLNGINQAYEDELNTLRLSEQIRIAMIRHGEDSEEVTRLQALQARNIYLENLKNAGLLPSMVANLMTMYDLYQATAAEAEKTANITAVMRDYISGAAAATGGLADGFTRAAGAASGIIRVLNVIAQQLVALGGVFNNLASMADIPILGDSPLGVAARGVLGGLGNAARGYANVFSGAAGAIREEAVFGGGSGRGGGGSGGQSELMRDLERFAKDAADMIGEALEEVMAQRQEWREAGVDLISSLLDGMQEGDLKSGFDNILNGARQSFQQFIKDLANGVEGVSFGNLFRNITGGFAQMTGGGGLGSILGGIGQMASGVMPIIGAASTIFNLVKGFSSSEVIGEGIRGQIGGGTSASDWEKTKRTSFWGLKSSTSTSSRFNADLTMMLGQAAKDARENVRGLVDTIGGPSRSLTKVVQQFNVETQQDLEEQIAMYSEKVALAALGTTKFTESGETYVETIQRLSGAMSEFNGVMEFLGFNVLPATVKNAAAASRVISVLGGPGGLASASQSYFSGILSQREQRNALRNQLNTSLRSIGLNPNNFRTADQFQSGVEGLFARGSNRAGAQLLGLSDLFSEWSNLNDAVRENKAAAEEAEKAERDLAKARRAAENDERKRLLIELYNLQGKITKARKLEDDALFKSNRSLQWRIWKLQDEQAIASEREGLDRTLLELQGNINELRRRELEALDPTNRELQRMIWGLQDAKKAMEELDPAQFATKFLYEQGMARARRRFSSPGNSGMGIVPANVSQDAQEIVTSNLRGLELVRNELVDIKTLMIDLRRYAKKSWDLDKSWDTLGLPPTRT